MRPNEERDNDAEIENSVRTPRPKSGFWGNPWVRIALFWAVYLVLSGLLLRLLSVIFAHTSPYPLLNGSYEMGSAFNWFIFTPLAGTVAVFFALWLMRRSEGASLWSSTGFVRQGAGASLLIGLLLGFIVQVVGAGIALLTSHRTPYQSSITLFSSLIFYTFVGNCLRGTNIEIILRGFIFQEFERRWGTLAALIGSIGLYWLYLCWWQVYVPISYGSLRGFDIIEVTFFQAMSALAGGLFFAGAYLLRRNLWLPIAAHVGAATAAGIALTFRVFYSSTYPTALVEIVAGAWLLYFAVKKGQWKSGPGTLEMARATYGGIAKLVEMTDPGKEADTSPSAPTSPNK